jgi:hypothetical protein
MGDGSDLLPPVHIVRPDLWLSKVGRVPGCPVVDDLSRFMLVERRVLACKEADGR